MLECSHSLWKQGQVQCLGRPRGGVTISTNGGSKTLTVLKETAHMHHKHYLERPANVHNNSNFSMGAGCET